MIFCYFLNFAVWQKCYFFRYWMQWTWVLRTLVWRATPVIAQIPLSTRRSLILHNCRTCLSRYAGVWKIAMSCSLGAMVSLLLGIVSLFMLLLRMANVIWLLTCAMRFPLTLIKVECLKRARGYILFVLFIVLVFIIQKDENYLRITLYI